MHATTFATLGEPRRPEIDELLRRQPFSVGDMLWEEQLDSLDPRRRLEGE